MITEDPEHEHVWVEELIKEPNFGVIFGTMRKCVCGAVEYADSTEGRVGGPWRPIKLPDLRKEQGE